MLFDFGEKRARLSAQFSDTRWISESGIARCELDKLVADIENKYTSPLTIRAKTFELIANHARIAIDAEGIFQDKLDGGGIISMMRVTLIVLISSAYSGVFQKTGLLNKIKNSVGRLAEKTTAFFAILICSALTGVVACNQTLTIMLTEQLTGDLKTDSEDFANNLEDTAVVIAPLIPWSIACAVPLTSVDAPVISVLFACYLYILPLCGLIRSFIRKYQNNKNL